MKKFINPIPDGGAPIHNNRINTELQTELWDVIEGLLNAYSDDTQGVIINGCISSGGTPYTVTAGIVFIDGEFRRLPAQTGQTGTRYITAGADANTAKLFADGVSKNLIVDQVATTAGAPSGQYITINNANVQAARRLENLAFNLITDYTTNDDNKPLAAAVAYDLKALLDSEASTRAAADSGEATARANADTTLSGSITTVAANLASEITNRGADVDAEETARINADALKANKALATAWTDIPYTARGTAPTITGTQRGQYCKDDMGRVHLRGAIKIVTGSDITTSVGVVGLLPAGFQPLIEQYYPAPLTNGGLYVFQVETVRILSSTYISNQGGIGIQNGNAGDEIVLDGICFLTV